jgi:lysine 2,3-aminomutase
LQRLLPTLTPEEYAGTQLANHKLALAITPYFFNLIDPADENCPIRWQVIPRVEETHTASWEMSDPCGEDSHSPVPGLVHRYPDRVLFLVTDRCAAYCRYCTRSRLVSNATGYDFHPDFAQQINYIREHPEVRDVLFSGGDPPLFSDEKLEHLPRNCAPSRTWSSCASERASRFSRNASRRVVRDAEEIPSAVHQHSLQSPAS